MRTSLLGVVLVLGANAAWAGDGWIDRPLVLPPGQVQLGTALDLSVADSSGASLVGSAALGVHPRLQLGVTLAEPIDPRAFGSVDGSAIAAVNDRLAVRLDAAIGHTTESVANDPNFPVTHTDYVLALGLPIEVPLSHAIAFVSGSTAASGFGRPFAHDAPDGISTAAGAVPTFFGESIVAVVVKEAVPSDFVVTLPAGILVAVSDRAALRVHGAVQTIWSGKRGEEGPFLATFLIGGAELRVRVAAHVDLGASIDAELAGTSTSTRYLYNELPGGVQLGLWMQGRFGA